MLETLIPRSKMMPTLARLQPKPNNLTSTRLTQHHNLAGFSTLHNSYHQYNTGKNNKMSWESVEICTGRQFSVYRLLKAIVPHHHG
jgi:hypothetical protein